MKLKHFQIVAWLYIKKRRAERQLDAMALQTRYTNRAYHYLEQGRRVPE